MVEIDLQKLGTLTASAENAKDYTFFIVRPNGSYTKGAFEANPDCVAAPDLILRSPAIPDRDGKAEFDLRPHGVAIREKLGNVPAPVKVFAVASARHADAGPPRIAEVVDLEFVDREAEAAEKRRIRGLKLDEPGAGAEIDVEKPGRMAASAENAKDYTFYLVLDKPQYTAEAFQQNPDCAAGADLLFKSAATADQGGKATLDLAPHAKAIEEKIKDAATKAKAVVVATSRPDSPKPDERLAAVGACTIKQPKGDLYGTSADGCIYRIDRKTGRAKVLANGVGFTEGGVSVDLRGRLFVSRGATLARVDCETGQWGAIGNFGGTSYYCAVDPETGDVYAPVHEAGTLQRVNPETGAKTQVAGGLSGAMGVAVAGDYVFVGSHTVGNVYLVNKKTGQTETFITLPYPPSRLGVRNDDELVVVGHPNHRRVVARVSIPERKVIRTYDTAEHYDVAFEEDGKILLAGGPVTRRLDPESGQITELTREVRVYGLALGPPKKRRSPPKPVVPRPVGRFDIWCNGAEWHGVLTLGEEGKPSFINFGYFHENYSREDARDVKWDGRTLTFTRAFENRTNQDYKLAFQPDGSFTGTYAGGSPAKGGPRKEDDFSPMPRGTYHIVFYNNTQALLTFSGSDPQNLTGVFDHGPFHGAGFGPEELQQVKWDAINHTLTYWRPVAKQRMFLTFRDGGRSFYGTFFYGDGVFYNLKGNKR